MMVRSAAPRNVPMTVPSSAEQGGPADHDRGDDVQLVTGSSQRRGRAEVGETHRPGETRGDRRQDEGRSPSPVALECPRVPPLPDCCRSPGRDSRTSCAGAPDCQRRRSRASRRSVPGSGRSSRPARRRNSDSRGPRSARAIRRARSLSGCTSMPSVTMKAGILPRVVIRPFTIPRTAASTRTSAEAKPKIEVRTSGRPAPSSASKGRRSSRPKDPTPGR